MRTIRICFSILCCAAALTAAACESSGGSEDARQDTDGADYIPPDGETGRACYTNYECSDGVYCNGVEACVGGLCQAGTPPDCADGYTCTQDSCDEDFNTCRHEYSNDLCNDGNVCNGVERCQPNLPLSESGTGCVSGTPVFCDDGNDCTRDFCDGETGACRIGIKDADDDGYGDRLCSFAFEVGMPVEGTDCYNPDDPEQLPEPGTVCKGTDCDDGDGDMNPAAAEVCDDGVDNNCDRMTDLFDNGCPPGNDTCASPETLPTDNSPVDGSTRGIRDDYTTNCGGASKLDVVFVLDLAEPHDVGLEVFGDFDAVIAVRSGNCSSTTNEIYCGEDSVWARGLQAGTYYVIVEGDVQGNFTISAELAPFTEVHTVPATNDNCTSPYELPPEGGLFIGSTTGMANDFTATCGGSSASPDAVFELELGSRKTVTVDTTTSYDGTLHMHSSPCVGGAQLACNDDYSGIQHSHISVTVNAGTYYIVMDGYSSSNSGNYEMNVVVTDPP